MQLHADRTLNFHYLARRVFRRPTCILEQGATLGPRAKILNARDKSEYIRIGKDSVVLGELFVFAHGGKIEIGKNCYIDLGSRIWSASSILIGDDVVVGPDVNIFDNLTHPLSTRERHQQVREILTAGHPQKIRLEEHAVKIGRGVVIGAGAIILRGVTIADNIVIAPREIVTKSAGCLPQRRDSNSRAEI